MTLYLISVNDTPLTFFSCSLLVSSHVLLFVFTDHVGYSWANVTASILTKLHLVTNMYVLLNRFVFLCELYVVHASAMLC
jgi:hypothetical protein